MHLGPAKVMKYNHVFDTVISADTKGMIEYWSPGNFEFPKDKYVLYWITLLSSFLGEKGGDL